MQTISMIPNENIDESQEHEVLPLIDVQIYVKTPSSVYHEAKKDHPKPAAA